MSKNLLTKIDSDESVEGGGFVCGLCGMKLEHVGKFSGKLGI